MANWAILASKDYKVIVRQNPRTEDEFIGYMLPEWIKDGRKRRRYKNAFYMMFICKRDDLIIGDPVELSINTDVREIFDGPELSGAPWLNVIAREVTHTITINGLTQSRTVMERA